MHRGEVMEILQFPFKYNWENWKQPNSFNKPARLTGCVLEISLNILIIFLFFIFQSDWKQQIVKTKLW